VKEVIRKSLREGKDEEDNVGSNGVGVLVDSGEGTG
jgi:hypothetical protein